MTFDPCIKALDAFRSSEAKIVCNGPTAQTKIASYSRIKFINILTNISELQELIMHW